MNEITFLADEKRMRDTFVGESYIFIARRKFLSLSFLFIQSVHGKLLRVLIAKDVLQL